jgi:hypothetical protein
MHPFAFKNRIEFIPRHGCAVAQDTGNLHFLALTELERDRACERNRGQSLLVPAAAQHHGNARRNASQCDNLLDISHC